jgi:exodeoxyribonuclease V alpha subunit
MTTVTAARAFEPLGPHDRRLARSATGVLGELNRAGLLTAADVHVAGTLARLGHEQDEQVVLAVALATRAVREGSVCVDLSRVAELDADVAWPEPGPWLERVRDSALARRGVLLVDLDLVYLQRYHHQEVQVCADLRARGLQPAPPVDHDLLGEGLGRVFPGEGYAEQRAAAQAAVCSWTTVLTGGPGTGKTTTVAGVLALLAVQHGSTGRPLRVALAAPTGKAAARLQEAVTEALEGILRADLPAAQRLAPEQRVLVEPLREVQASTLHRLLGRRPGSSTRFRHDRSDRLPHDVVVVDESSMMSLTMTARLLEAVRPQARLLLVGDPDQLVSIDAGAVLADLVAGLQESDPAGAPAAVARLRTVHRFGHRIGALAQALREGDADEVVAVLRDGGGEVDFLEEDDPTARLRGPLTRQALALREAALSGDETAALAALDQQRLLCAHRDGPHGVRTWNQHVEQWVTETTGDGLWDPMYPGRPLLVTANDYGLALFNGDTGVVVRGEDGGTHAVFAGPDGLRRLAVSRLADVDTMHAMTIHKAQGSQAREVVVLLPDDDSLLLTRELLYTAVTRAQERVVVVGSEAVVRAAVDRQVRRASGLRRRIGTPG